MTKLVTTFLLVGAGGFAGSVARYALSAASLRVAAGWPLGTFLCNVLGCLFIGVLAGVWDRGHVASPAVRLALATGFCGGFTTMSTLVYDTTTMLRASEYRDAVLYAAGTILISFAAFLAGLSAVRVAAGAGPWN